MTDPMDQPVTKRDLQTSFDAFLGVLMERLDQRFETIDQRFETIDQRFETIDQRFEQARVEMLAVVDNMADTLRTEMRQLSAANLEAIRGDLQKYDDKYSDLPARVSRLEDAVFKATPNKRRRSR